MKRIRIPLCLALLCLTLLCACGKTNQTGGSGSKSGTTFVTIPDNVEITVSPGSLIPTDQLSHLLKDGRYRIAVTLSGGTGKATVASPAELELKDGQVTATLVWSSANYDYMLVDGVRYDAEIVDGHSTFKIPVSALDQDLTVIGDTVAMSTPHEIEYTLRFDSSTLEAAEE